MPTSKSSLINLSQYSKSKIESLFEKSLALKSRFKKGESFSATAVSGRTAALLFFEPSTRTRFSFEAACVRAGFHPLVLDGGIGTSLEKGETVIDTIRNIEAMQPQFFIIRCDQKLNLAQLAEQMSFPVINAGWGSEGHPTQALLDMLSLYEKDSPLENKKILFVGDVKHSRVVSSHFELARILNYKIGICGPPEFRPGSESKKVFNIFETLEQGLAWADVVIALRVQKERHDGSRFDDEKYATNFGLNKKKLNFLSDKGWIMHPGPINYGIEMEENILQDPRTLILQQVENGVFLREALIRNLFEEI